MFHYSPESDDAKQADALLPAAAADLNPKTDSNSKSDGDNRLWMISCILEFKMGIDPVTFESTYSLRAVQYVRKPDIFTNLDDNARWGEDGSTTKKKFFQSLKADNANSILDLFKSGIIQGEYLKVGNAMFKPTYYAVISGILAECQSKESRQFGEKEFNNLNCFLSYVDLVIRNEIHIDKEALEKQFAYQERIYGIALSDDEKWRLKLLLRSHLTIHTRNAELQKYITQKLAKKDEQSSATMLNNVHTFFAGLSDSLSSVWASPRNVTINNEVASPADLVQERLNVVARLRKDEYENVGAQKQDLKRLFALRPYFVLDDVYYNRHIVIDERISQFWHSIDKKERWQEPSVIKQAKELMIEAILMTDEMLADMEHFLRQAGAEPTASNMAKLLTNQQLTFCRSFMYCGIIDFYATYREKDTTDHAESNELFFRNDSAENALRKLYNTFIKHGFYQRYGNEFGRDLTAADSRFIRWSSKDSKVQQPMLETWPEFFQRSLSGQEKPMEERCTYLHPFGSTRPT